MKIVLAMVTALAVTAGAAAADETVSFRVGYSAGGSYDINARLVAEFLPAYLAEGTGIIVENAPGAGSLTLAKTMMFEDATDGTSIATISSALALSPIFDPESTDFDPQKVHYIASLSNAASYCVAHKSSGIETLQQLLDSSDAKVGATGRGSTTYTFPSAIKTALNGQFEIVVGFKGGNEIDLAMERGDVDVRCGIGLNTLVRGDALERLNVIAEIALEPKGEMDGIDFALDFAPDAETRAALELVFASGSVHHPVIAGPNTTEEAVDALRAAFSALATDPDFVAANEDRRAFINITDGATVEAIIDGFLSAPDDVKELARTLVQ
ncbi:tripartite tricarboxylate transporter substrate-binding protein [Yoonia sp. R78084]|uniref:tripartite tricarboxylate transporter substrate-binding protein n=1 Tax=Yoonia sp. R78084 TaxID=3093869 RepID=UPI0037DC65D9